MEVTKEQISTFEQRMEGFEKKLNAIGNNVDKFYKILESIDRGLNGDKANDTPGVKQKLLTMQSEIDTLRGEVDKIHIKDAEQDITLSTRKNTRSNVWEIMKIIWSIVSWIFMAYFAYKGLIGWDALHK